MLSQLTEIPLQNMSGKAGAAERKHGWKPEHTEALRKCVLEHPDPKSLTGGLLKDSHAVFAHMDVNYLSGRLRSLRKTLDKGLFCRSFLTIQISDWTLQNLVV